MKKFVNLSESEYLTSSWFTVHHDGMGMGHAVYKFPPASKFFIIRHSTVHPPPSIFVPITKTYNKNFIMLSQVSVFAALVAVVLAGQEAPPAKAVHYNVPNVAKVSYPGPTVTRNVETYSAPSIEKTVLITRTITAPLNAPAVKSVSYSAPAAPVAAYGAPVAAYGAPVAAYGAPALAAAPIAATYAAAVPAVAQVAYAGVPAYSGYAAHGHGINGQTVYAAPALGYSLGQTYAAAPVYQAAVAAPVYQAAPVAAHSYAAPAAEYGAPASAGY